MTVTAKNRALIAAAVAFVVVAVAAVIWAVLSGPSGTLESEMRHENIPVLAPIEQVSRTACMSVGMDSTGAGLDGLLAMGYEHNHVNRIVDLAAITRTCD